MPVAAPVMMPPCPSHRRVGESITAIPRIRSRRPRLDAATEREATHRHDHRLEGLEVSRGVAPSRSATDVGRI